MERSSKRGKVPQQDWPSIIKRYEAGETLASIARTYDCSPPAISYILSRSRARDATVDGTEQSAIKSSETRLPKGHPDDTPVSEFINGTPEIGEAAALPPTAKASDPIDASIPEPMSAGPSSGLNGTAGVSEIGADIDVTETTGRPAQRDIEEPAQAAPSGNGTAGSRPQPVEPRRRLHLALSHNNAQLMDTPHPDGHVIDTPDASVVRPVGDQHQGLPQHPARHHPAPSAAANDGGAVRSTAESHKRDGGAFIDRALRDRVDGDISAFLAAFDAALAEDTIESRADLRDATDRLLRAGARTRIELERLEARVPLSSRDRSGYSSTSWRPR